MAKEPFIKFDNHVSIGHIFTTISLIVGGTAFAMDMSNRVSNLEKYNVVIDRRVDDLRGSIKESLLEIKQDVKEISHKLDEKEDRRTRDYK